MLIDFFESCSPVLNEEANDYKHILQEIKRNQDPFIGFMPAIIEDMWPIFIMECTKAKQYNTHSGDSFYIIPYGAHDFWGVYGLNDIMHKWYDNDEIDIGENCELEIEETILLKTPEIQSEHVIEICNQRVNAVYLKFRSNNTGKSIHTMILIDEPHEIWTNVIEHYDINTDILIDSHKGMGDWFDKVPLSTTMNQTSKIELLPSYYFKGKFIHEAPAGFEMIYNIPEANGKNWCACSIYKTNWK